MNLPAPLFQTFIHLEKLGHQVTVTGR